MSNAWQVDAGQCVSQYFREFPDQLRIVDDRDHNSPFLLYTNMDVVRLIDDIISRFGFRLSASSVALTLRSLHNERRKNPT